jgi:2-polyprenyl-3-methyl-5-hydroxy-6-metoxy-1,4-benzoquinol methylase
MSPQFSSDPAYYNEMYLHNDRTFDDPARSPYMPVFRGVVEEARRHNVRALLEVGCGSGTLARMLIEELNIEYAGFDIAVEGIKKARARNPNRGSFFVGDATDPASYKFNYDVLVCVEVLEHIPDDLNVIQKWRSGVSCICSVPNFDHETHVRKFNSEREVRSRYGDLIQIDRLDRIRKRVWSGGLTYTQYLRRIRWNLNNPSYVAGLLGINGFANYGGWFLFSGRRR